MQAISQTYENISREPFNIPQIKKPNATKAVLTSPVRNNNLVLFVDWKMLPAVDNTNKNGIDKERIENEGTAMSQFSP